MSRITFKNIYDIINNKILLWLLTFILAIFCTCDLPPNCLHGDVVGTWRIYIGKYRPCEKHKDFEDPTCGFPSPDRDDAHDVLTPLENGLENDYFEELYSLDIVFTNDDFEIVYVTVNDNYSIKNIDIEKENTKGKWTVLLDQGLMFWTEKNRYSAFFKYINEKEGINMSYSYCHTTLLGWWDSNFGLSDDNDSNNRILSTEERNKVNNFPWLLMKNDLKLNRGCWYGMRLLDGNGKKTNRKEWTLKLPRWRISPLGLPPDHPINANNPSVSEYLNEISSRYSNINDEYKLWNSKREFKIKGRNDLDTLNKVRKELRISPHFLPIKKSEDVYVGEISKVSKTNDFKDKNEVPIWLRLNYFDWSNNDHVYGRIGKRYNIIPKSSYQGDCGNCFSLTAATIITTRLWIKYHNEEDVFGKLYASSIQMTDCNVYNQGCAGGLITLAFKFAQEVGIRTEECIEDYSKLIGVKKIFPTPVYTPDEMNMADDGHSFLELSNKVKSKKDNSYNENINKIDGEMEYVDNNVSDMEEYVEGSDMKNDYHISSSYDYTVEQAHKKEQVHEQIKFKIKQQMCWDLGGQLGSANTKCNMNIPITKNIPKSCSKLIRVMEYGYVNGVYGKSTTEDIMESIWKEGPIAVSLEPTIEFSLYESGVFKGFYDPIKRKYPWSNISWYKVDHAMVITGWGWEVKNNERIPYWIVQNSWGESWGEKGYCRIIRGINELSIEHAAVRASVLLYDTEKVYKESDINKFHDESVFKYIK
ncbi:secreted papain like protease [Cryptosporidium ryanae]|uniref:secreted papain like protease n=1 Tax=Cryptosporidium ryanae TaxID=515981 RepID=UPI00351A5DBC|nr:secreted papain like protease [Cryptosporidium ryanae]